MEIKLAQSSIRIFRLPECIVRFFDRSRGDGANDGGEGVSPQRWLQDSRELRVPVVYVLVGILAELVYHHAQRQQALVDVSTFLEPGFSCARGIGALRAGQVNQIEDAELYCSIACILGLDNLRRKRRLISLHAHPDPFADLRL